MKCNVMYVFFHVCIHSGAHLLIHACVDSCAVSIHGQVSNMHVCTSVYEPGPHQNQEPRLQFSMSRCMNVSA